MAGAPLFTATCNNMFVFNEAIDCFSPVLASCLYVLHFFQYQGNRPKDYIAMIVIYTVLSLVKASFTLVALATKGGVSAPTAIAQRVDTVWVALALFAPFFFHPPSATKEIYSEQLLETTEEYRKMRLKTYIVVNPRTHVRRDTRRGPVC